MDFSRVCRTCLGTKSLKSIFAETVDHRQHSAVILITTGIKVQPNDGLPQQMCLSCVRFINESIKFRRQCKESNTKLIHHKRETDKLDNIKIEDLNDHLEKELKCEFDVEFNTEIVKTENDPESDDENDKLPLSFMTEVSLKEENVKEDSLKEDCRKEDIVEHDEECDVTFTHTKQQTEDLEEHKLCDVKKNVDRVACPQCQKDLSRRSLRAHIAACHAGLRCVRCKLECGSREALAAHSASCPRKRLQTWRTAKEIVKCEECSKTMQRASLRAHMAVKHKGMGPVCEHCGRRFGNKLRLIEHLRAKHGHEKLQCSHCEFSSASWAALQNHERRHRGEKPFVCETCGANFHAAYLLAQHRYSHSTEKKVKCDECGSMFKSSNSLAAHRLARHGARAHRCPLCARAYRSRHYAVKHMRAVHRHQGKVPPLQVEPAPEAS